VIGSLVTDHALYFVDFVANVVGASYNNVSQTPYKGPANQTVSFFPQYLNQNSSFSVAFYTGVQLPLTCGRLVMGITSLGVLSSTLDCADAGIAASFNASSGITVVSFSGQLPVFSPSLINQAFCGPFGYCGVVSGKCTCALSSFSYDGQRNNCIEMCSRFGGQTNVACPPGGCLGFTVRFPRLEEKEKKKKTERASLYFSLFSDYVANLPDASILSMIRPWSQAVQTQTLKAHNSSLQGCETGVPTF
jgi:hypothetical protein